MQGFCPNCNTGLTENNIVSTKESAIFKGHNVYCMCKHCGYVMIYNKERDLIFSLDRFKDDEDIIKEIYDLLNEATDNGIESVSKAETEEEIKEEVHHSCEGNCASCS
jgi:predicted nucleic-acid-binding Zn-ribbon protein